MSSISTSFRIQICDRKLATNTLFKSHFKNFEGKKEDGEKHLYYYRKQIKRVPPKIGLSSLIPSKHTKLSLLNLIKHVLFGHFILKSENYHHKPLSLSLIFKLTNCHSLSLIFKVANCHLQFNKEKLLSYVSDPPLIIFSIINPSSILCLHLFFTMGFLHEYFSTN